MKGSTELQLALQKWAKQQGDSTSIVETYTDKKITYQDLYYSVVSLQEFLGSSPKSIVTTLPGGIVNSVIWLTALIYGHHLIPASPFLTDVEFHKLIERHRPDVLITETPDAKTVKISGLLPSSQLIKILTKGIREKKSPQQEATDGILYLETSGSTGEPKGMILNATQLVITANLIREHHQLTPKSRGLTPLPFYHVNAPIVSMLSSILAGATVIIAPKFSASKFWKWVEKYDPTWISIVPTIVAILLKYDKPAFLTKPSLRFVRTASAPLPKANLIAFEKKFGFPVIETYGISEAGSTITANPLPPKKHKPGSVGFPLGIAMKIVDQKTGKELSQGKTGEVCIKGKQVITHYENGLGADAYEHGWFRTGDLGYFDKDGYLFLNGRKKDIIIRGGENIFPREIEEVLLTYPSILEAAVVGHQDEILGEKVVAFVVNPGKNGKKLPEAIKTFATKKLSQQKVPAKVYLLDQLPRGKTGKIDKNILRTYSE